MKDYQKLVEQMLRKAESTTPEEAEALTDAAERLIVKHSIEVGALSLGAENSDVAREQVVTREVVLSKPYALGFRYMLSQVLGVLPNIQLLISRGVSGEALKIIGPETAADHAQRLAESLLLQSITEMWRWWNGGAKDDWYASNQNRFLARRQFIVSFGAGAAERLRPIVAEEASGAALVLADQKSAMDEYMAEHYPNVRASRSRSRGSSAGREAGRAAGRRANTGDAQVGGQRRALTR